MVTETEKLITAIKTNAMGMDQLENVKAYV